MHIHLDIQAKTHVSAGSGGVAPSLIWVTFSKQKEKNSGPRAQETQIYAQFHIHFHIHTHKFYSNYCIYAPNSPFLCILFTRFTIHMQVLCIFTHIFARNPAYLCTTTKIMHTFTQI